MPRVTDDVMRRVADAITVISHNPETPRTKRAIEAASGLSHDAVARAFRQDRAEGSPFELNTRFERLVAEHGSRRAPTKQREHEAKDALREAKQRISELEDALSAHAQVIVAQQLELDALRDPERRVVPIIGRRNVPK